MPRYQWDFSQPLFRARSDDPDRLGVDYSTGVDNRWDDGARNGPKLTTLDLSSVGGTTAAVNKGALIKETSGSNYHYYVARGTGLGKVRYTAGNAALALATTQPTALAEAVTDLLVTQAPGGNPMLSIAMNGTIYRNITAVAAHDAGDTVSANDESKIRRILGAATESEIAGFLGQQAFRNILSAAKDMDDSAWTDLAAYSNDQMVPTGFALSENLWLWGTNIGLLIFNSRDNQFFPSFGPLPADPDNCRAMKTLPWLGTLVPFKNMLRLQVGGNSERVGPEAWGSPNVIQGTVTGIGNDMSWAYPAIRNPSNSTTYLLAARPRQEGDNHAKPLSYYCIASFSDECKWVDVPSDVGAVRTNPLTIVGKGSDIAYFMQGRGQQWPDDANYAYELNTDQSIYGTMLRRRELEKLKRLTFAVDNLTSTRTVAAGIEYLTETQQVVSRVVLPATSRSQVYSLDVSAIGDAIAFRPYFTLKTATGSETSSPILRYRVEMETVNG